ncbi:MAG: hemerythrin domain-containing protein [Alphaproteobacteria bacterium]
MNIFNKIKKDHDEAREIMDKILKTPQVKKRQELFGQLKVAILSHAKSEEETFYKSLRKNGDKEMKEEIPHFKEEHEEVEKLFKSIEKLDPDDYMWWEQFGELRKALTHHMKEEEEDVFPDARKDIPKTEAQEIGEEMADIEEEEKNALMRKEGMAA